jgi:Ca2+-binding EF-hand superfamily protein
MPKGESQLPPALEAQLRKLFNKMDRDRDQILSKDEAVEYWGKNFAKINAQAMFNEVTPAIVSTTVVSSHRPCS